MRHNCKSYAPKDITFVFNWSYTSLYWTQEWRKAACSGCRILIFFFPLLFILLAKAEIHVLWIRFIGPLMSIIVEFKCRYKFVSLKAIQVSRVTKIRLSGIARFNCKINALCWNLWNWELTAWFLSGVLMIIDSKVERYKWTGFTMRITITIRIANSVRNPNHGSQRVDKSYITIIDSLKRQNI